MLTLEKVPPSEECPMTGTQQVTDPAQVRGHRQDTAHPQDTECRSPDSYSVGIVGGDGLIARFGDIVLYLLDGTGAAELITAAESAAAAADPARALATNAATAALGAGPAAASSFGAAVPVAGGTLLLLRGPVQAEVTTGETTRRLSGERALTWVDEMVPGHFSKLTLGHSGALLRPAEHSTLRSGVVPGAGFVISRTDTVRAPAADIPTAVQRVPPGPTITSRKAATEPPATQVMRALNETATLAPVVGALESDEGAVFPLDRSYVIGRDPLGDEAVRNASASPIVLADPYVSRVHAYVTVECSAVSVRDAATPGGTYLAAPGASTWSEVGTTATELHPGWSVRIGDRILNYRAGDHA
jgi:hypothetical protein